MLLLSLSISESLVIVESFGVSVEMMQQSLFGSFVQAQSCPDEGQATRLDTPLAEAIFTVLDLETTGLNPTKNAITEMVAIQYRNGQALDKMASLVKPTEEIPPEVTAITGITNEMVAGAPPAVMALSELCGFVGPSPLIVGHNVSFDVRFLREKLDETGLAAFTPRIAYEKAFCTKVLAQKALPGLPSYEGIVVAHACGVKNDNPHRAEYDVRMAAEILFALIERLKQQGHLLYTVGDLLALQGPLKP